MKKTCGGEGEKTVQEIRNSCVFSCGRFLLLVVKGPHYTEINRYFAIVSPLC